MNFIISTQKIIRKNLALIKTLLAIIEINELDVTMGTLLHAGVIIYVYVMSS